MGETVSFLRFLAGRRGARTSLTTAERELLARLARGCRSIVEVGVYEGATSSVLAASIAEGGKVILVDPFEPALKIERLFRFSCPRVVATRTLRPWRDRIRFVRARSLEAARLDLPEPPELIFIDADHAYEAVREDFLAWSARLAGRGRIALHDSRPCLARPDLDHSTGPVRLVAEIERGDWAPWQVENLVDSITVVTRHDLRPPPRPGGSAR